MSDGSAADANPLFATNQQIFGEQREYSQVAEGNLGTAVADLHTAQVQLGVQETDLNNQKQHRRRRPRRPPTPRPPPTGTGERAERANSVNGQLSSS